MWKKDLYEIIWTNGLLLLLSWIYFLSSFLRPCVRYLGFVFIRVWQSHQYDRTLPITNKQTCNLFLWFYTILGSQRLDKIMLIADEEGSTFSFTILFFSIFCAIVSCVWSRGHQRWRKTLVWQFNCSWSYDFFYFLWALRLRLILMF